MKDLVDVQAGQRYSSPPATTANTAVIIPALNEEASLPDVIARLHQIGLHKIRVVDNGSSDRTAEEARQRGAEVIREPRRGYGRACWTGCENLSPEVEWILFCNADGSDDIERVPDMMAATDAQAEFVIGVRTSGEDGDDHLTAMQKFGNKLATTLIRIPWGTNYADLGPLRLISRRAFERLNLQDRGFGWTVEMQVRAAEEKLNVGEVSVRSFPRHAGVSKISGTIKGSVQAGTIILTTIANLWLKRPGVQRAAARISAFLLPLGAMLMLPFGNLAVAGDVPRFLMGAGVMCAGYVVAWALRKPSLALLWTVAVSTRLILLFMQPGDDTWRYVWEGRVTLAGFNPYQLAPNAVALGSLRDAVIWPHVGHPTLTTIYPPVAQLCFALLASFGAGVFVFKLAFALADLMVAALLLKRFGRNAALIYAWNPLVIYSFAGGGHYDSLFILPLVGALVLAGDSRDNWRSNLSALLLGCSIAVKWASGPLVFWWLRRAWRERGLWQALLTGTFAALPMAATLLVFFPGTAFHQLGPHDWMTYSWSVPLLPGLIKWLTVFSPHDEFWLLPVLIA
ncbi:MAG: glycosyltransferase family 2 protein, partial [Verrucomicrobia bacterium]|nr:glycosyltransferase family 2 protein [Verrucomicrobiota bacterium]